MNGIDSLKSFGEVLSAIIDSRGIASDEALARKAMRVQDRQARRINVQRKTINNWRNDRSMPRSITDRQFQLVLTALEVKEVEISALAKFLETSQAEQGQDSSSNLPVGINRQSWMFVCLALVLMVSVAWMINQSFFKSKGTYLNEIPATELSLTAKGFVLPNSGIEEITYERLENLSGWELYVARNEIYARHGWAFTKASSICLQNHFDKLAKTSNSNGWYEQTAKRGQPSNLASSNADKIREYECNERKGQFKCNGRLNQCE